MAKAMVGPRDRGRDPVPASDRGRGYGYGKGWRVALEQADIFHVMATSIHDTVVTRQALDHPVRDPIASLPRQRWKRCSCGDGAHGRRIYDWAHTGVRPSRREDRKHWVLARRSNTRPDEIAYYIAYAPANTTMEELIAAAGARWRSRSASKARKVNAA